MDEEKKGRRRRRKTKRRQRKMEIGWNGARRKADRENG